MEADEGLGVDIEAVIGVGDSGADEIGKLAAVEGGDETDAVEVAFHAEVIVELVVNVTRDAQDELTRELGIADVGLHPEIRPGIGHGKSCLKPAWAVSGWKRLSTRDGGEREQASQGADYPQGLQHPNSRKSGAKR